MHLSPYTTYTILGWFPHRPLDTREFELNIWQILDFHPLKNSYGRYASDEDGLVRYRYSLTVRIFEV